MAVALVSMVVAHASARTVAIEWVLVGDPGNAADTAQGGFGAVADDFQIMKYLWTNSLYVDFLNAIDPQGTNPNLVYNPLMASNARGGITNTGSTDGSRYVVKANMGDKPVNFVSWWDAARVANWLHNGAQTYGSSDASASAPQNTGAYTLGTGTNGSAPVVNPGAKFFLPSENQWYKAAYYKGGGTNAGYWIYATQSDTPPTAVSSGPTGIGSAGSMGNFANCNYGADWNGLDGNVTTVGTNGGPSAYGAFDMNGNVYEWNDLSGLAGSTRGLRGGDYTDLPTDVTSSFILDASLSSRTYGFRLAAVPEPSTCVMGLMGIAGVAATLWRRRTLA